MNKKIIGSITAIVGLVISVLSLIFFIKSFGAEDYGEYGREFWADNDYLVFLIIGIIYTIFGVYTFLKYDSDNKLFIKNSIFVLLITGFIDLAYCYGKFFKEIAKNQEFSTWYFLFGLAGVLLFACGVMLYFINKDKKNA